MQQVYDNISNVLDIEPELVQHAIIDLREEHGDEEIDEALSQLVYEIPTGEGLTKKEARKLLIEEMDRLIILGNQSRLRNYRKATNAYWERQEAIHTALKAGVEPSVKPGLQPREPIFVRGFGSRHLDQAVSKARGLGTYTELLAAAGFRAKQRR